MTDTILPLVIFVVALFLAGVPAGCSDGGRSGFYREIWALGESNAFRVNSPDAKTGQYRDRPEVQKDGVLRIEMPLDPDEVQAAELYLELWGGHPGTENKRFVLNGKQTYPLPEVGTAEGHCTYSYPRIALDVTDLQQGENTFAFTCEKGDSFWGHYLIRTACLRLKLKPDSRELRAAGLTDAEITVRHHVEESLPRTVLLNVDAPQPLRARIAQVEYYGKYEGYDENGNGRSDDWHGFTKDGEARGHIATATTGEDLRTTWPLTMVSPARGVEVRSLVRFADHPDLVYETRAVEVLPPEEDSPVRLFPAEDMPVPFWSRADRPKQCWISLPVEPDQIEQAELHVLLWDGGSGTTAKPFTLNGHPLPAAGKGAHDLLYRVIPIDRDMLRKGDNDIRVVSDTEHHGIEVLLPGPALMVRFKPDVPVAADR